MPHYNITFFDEDIENVVQQVSKINLYTIDHIVDKTYRIVCPFSIEQVIELITEINRSLKFIICYTYSSTAYKLNSQVQYYQTEE